MQVHGKHLTISPNIRRAILLTTWLLAWLKWPQFQAELLTAAGGALFVYMALQVVWLSGKASHP